MKQLYFFLILSIIVSINHTIHAQGYIRGGGGFGIGTNKDAFSVPAITRNDNNIVVSAKTVFGSFGQGGRFSLAGGYMITPYLGIELQFYYFLGTKEAYGSDMSPNNNSYSRTGFSYQLRALPSLVIKAPTEKVQPYARFGVLIPLLGQTILEDQRYIPALNQTIETQLNINGKFSVGFESSVGVQYNVTKNIGIYAELTYTGLRIRSQDGEYTKDVTTNSNDGTVTDNLPNRQTITRYIEFQDEITLESNHNTALLVTGQIPADVGLFLDGQIDFDRPLNVLTQTSNFNALSLNVGVQYTFNQKAK